MKRKLENLNNLISELFNNGAKVISTLHGGMMNQSFVVESNNKKYVLYIPGDDANEMVDRELEKINHSLVYHLGITSKNVFFDTKDGIKVNRFIEGDSLNHIKDIDYKKIAIMLKKLHKGGPLTNADYLPFSRLEIFEEERKSYDKNIDNYYKVIKSLLIEKKDYLLKDKLVLSHNDFQRSNIIKDLDDNYYLIDFEFMANNVDLYDVACFGNDSILDGEELLKAYKDDAPSLDDFKKFYLWRMFISLQWHNVAIIKHFKGEGETHNINFLDVANHFLNNAIEVYKKYHLLEK
jgi:thiamine kinase-like enzyme